MRKVIAIVIVILLAFSSASFASLGTKKDGAPTGAIYDIDVKGGYSTRVGSVLNLFTSGYNDGVTTNVSSESNLTSAALAFGVIKLEAGSAKSISLGTGTAGQALTIIMTVEDGKTITITDDQLSAAGQAAMVTTGWDDIAFDAVNDTVTLLYVDSTIGWIITGQAGVAIT